MIVSLINLRRDKIRKIFVSNVLGFLCLTRGLNYFLYPSSRIGELADDDQPET